MIQTPPFYGRNTGQPALAGTYWRILLGAKFYFYCLHALADDNQRIRIREKTPEFSSTEY